MLRLAGRPRALANSIALLHPGCLRVRRHRLAGRRLGLRNRRRLARGHVRYSPRTSVFGYRARAARMIKMTESHNVSANGRADIFLAEPGCLALQVEEPA